MIFNRVSFIQVNGFGFRLKTIRGMFFNSHTVDGQTVYNIKMILENLIHTKLPTKKLVQN